VIINGNNLNLHFRENSDFIAVSILTKLKRFFWVPNRLDLLVGNTKFTNYDQLLNELNENCDPLSEEKFEEIMQNFGFESFENGFKPILEDWGIHKLDDLKKIIYYFAKILNLDMNVKENYKDISTDRKEISPVISKSAINHRMIYIFQKIKSCIIADKFSKVKTNFNNILRTIKSIEFISNKLDLTESVEPEKRIVFKIGYDNYKPIMKRIELIKQFITSNQVFWLNTIFYFYFTFCKPEQNRLEKELGIPPRFNFTHEAWPNLRLQKIDIKPVDEEYFENMIDWKFGTLDEMISELKQWL